MSLSWLTTAAELSGLGFLFLGFVFLSLVVLLARGRLVTRSAEPPDDVYVYSAEEHAAYLADEARDYRDEEAGW
jgi:hypothetical protein